MVVVVSSRGRRFRPGAAVPLHLLASGTAAITTETREVDFYFVCQTKYEPTAEEAQPHARWKVNYYTFTVQNTDFFDVTTRRLTGAAGVQWDDNGGWFAVVSPTPYIQGDYGITNDGFLYIRAKIFKQKLGEGGLIRARYKHPNPSGDLSTDQVYTSDMTLVGLPRAALRGTNDAYFSGEE